MANKKKMAMTLGAMALTAVIAIGGTLAYLSTITNTKDNKFTSSGNITGKLEEPDWDFDNGIWDEYLPGDKHGKNPFIDLTNTNVWAAVGMKVACIDADGKEISFADFQTKYAKVYHDLNGASTLGYNTVDWTESAQDGFFYYNTTIKNGTTATLFDDVEILSGIKRVYYNNTASETIKVYKTDENGNKVGEPIEIKKGETITVNSGEKVFVVDATGETEVSGDVTLPSFTISVTGYAVQAESQTAAGAPSAADIANLTTLAYGNN